MLTLSAGLRIRGFQPKVSRWDPPLGCPEQSAKPLPTVPSGLLWWMACLSRDPGIPTKHLKEAEDEKSPFWCEEYTLREGKEVWGEPLKDNRGSKLELFSQASN